MHEMLAIFYAISAGDMRKDLQNITNRWLFLNNASIVQYLAVFTLDKLVTIAGCHFVSDELSTEMMYF